MLSFVVVMVVRRLIGSYVLCVFMSVFAGCVCYFIFRCVDPVMVMVCVFYLHMKKQKKS